MLGELAQATPLAKATAATCPDCGARLESSGRRRRSLRTRNQRHVERREKAAKTRRARLSEAVRWIAGDARGRLYLADLVRESGVDGLVKNLSAKNRALEGADRK